MLPEFDRPAVVAWLLANDRIEVPTEAPVASLVLVAGGGGTHRFRLEDPWLVLAEDAAGEDRCWRSAWVSRPPTWRY